VTTVIEHPAAPDDRRTRLRLLALLGVLALLAGALALGTRDDAPTPRFAAEPDAAELASLRADAALDACPPGLGAGLPDLVLPCLAGGDDVALAAAGTGRPALVNVWASWCGPCVREVPHLAAFRDRAGDRVDLVGVLTQDSRRAALVFAQETGMRWPSVVDDDGAVMRRWSPAPPITLFVDAAGSVVHVERGEVTSPEQVEALVAEHLGVVL
jgi:cytochrome c biogenesis protein CcmG, thiol:disulfide interchange protein DsbE